VRGVDRQRIESELNETAVGVASLPGIEAKVDNNLINFRHISKDSRETGHQLRSNHRRSGDHRPQKARRLGDNFPNFDGLWRHLVPAAIGYKLARQVVDALNGIAHFPQHLMQRMVLLDSITDMSGECDYWREQVFRS
jgi:hypothetical protein